MTWDPELVLAKKKFFGAGMYKPQIVLLEVADVRKFN
jgi:hypothetical protein